MTFLEPKETYYNFLAGKIDKSSVISYYVSLIEKSYKDRLRIDALKFLGKMRLKSQFYFNFLEYLLISDEEHVIKAYATKFLIESFPNRAFQPIQWALQNIDWNSISNFPKIALSTILMDLRNTNNPKLLSLLNLREHVVVNDKVFLVNNDILNLNNLGIKSVNQIEGLEKLTNLKELHLSRNNILKIKGLNHLINLKLLDLSYNKIQKIQGLEEFINLNQLFLNNNHINYISGLVNLINLHYLNLAFNNIVEINGLNNNQNLHTLNLSYNNIITIKNLSSLNKLFFLALNNNNIRQIEGLESLINLRVLRLNNNDLTEIKGLNHLEKLTTLNLAHNKIKNIADSILPPLFFFNLDNNQISDDDLKLFYKNHVIFKHLYCF